MTITLHNANAFDIFPTLADNSIDLIATDWPYFRVKSEGWDRQWPNAQAYLDWLDTTLVEFYRLLKPNGSLYVFASPKMVAQVEILVRKRLNVLNHIVWAKPPFSTKAEMSTKEAFRQYWPTTEYILFAEHHGVETYAKGESGYSAKCDKVRGFVFEPLRAYLDGERKRAAIDKVAINIACGFSATPGGMASRHYFSQSQWWLPTQEHYDAMQRLFNTQGRSPVLPYEQFHDAPRSRFEPGKNGHGPEYLRAEYEDLRAEYEDLRAEYEDLRRPFNVTADVPYTDVWTFPTVQAYPGKHPCEKPLEMMRHIVRASSRPGATVLDPFGGTFTTAVACVLEDRDCIAIERERAHFEQGKRRVARAGCRAEIGTVQEVAAPETIKAPAGQMTLF
jgi:site-specific DNA-methyltransferase (adenine-specific)